MCEQNNKNLVLDRMQIIRVGYPKVRKNKMEIQVFQRFSEKLLTARIWILRSAAA